MGTKTLMAIKKEGQATPAFEVRDTNGTVTIRVDDVQILAERGAAIADATDNPTAITQLNLALAALRTHGLIAT